MAQPYIYLGVGIGIGFIFLLIAMSNLKKKRLIDDTPTSKARGVFIGLVEVAGTILCQNPLISRLGEKTCVQYRWRVQEQWRRSKVETYRDSKGKMQTRTKVESGWKDVAGGEEHAVFDLYDDSGCIQIQPQGANCDGVLTVNKLCNTKDPMYFEKGPSRAIPDSTHTRKFFESVIPIDSYLYVIGQSREREDIVAPEIAADKTSPIFLISTKDEKKISRGYAFYFWFFTLLGLGVAELIVWFGELMIYPLPPSYTNFYLWAALIYGGMWGAGFLWKEYNSLKGLNERVRQAFSQVNVQFQRRKDLIPALAAAIRGLMAHEQKVQSQVGTIRAEMESNPLKAEKGLIAIVEAYPDLKSSDSVMRLQEAIIDTEDRIQLARSYYNDIATFYNTRLHRFPDNLIGLVARLKPRELIRE